MKLTLMAPFRVDFCLDSRAISHIYPSTASDYFAFWDELSKKVCSHPAKAGLGGTVTYRHQTNEAQSDVPEYSSIARDTAVVPAETLRVRPKCEKATLNKFWREAMNVELEKNPKHYGSVSESIRCEWPHWFDADPKSLELTIFDNTIAIIEISLNFTADNTALQTCLERFLDAIQGTANGFVTAYVDDYYKKRLQPFLIALYQAQPFLSKFLLDPGTIKCFRDLDLTDADAKRQAAAPIRVRWVTRTLHFPAEKRNAPDHGLYEATARYWLANTGAHSDAEEIIDDKRSFSFRWVKYIHWPRSPASDDAALADGWEATLDYKDAWDGLRLAEYFYATIDALNVNLSLILGIALSRKAIPMIRELNETLREISSRTKLVTLNFRERERYLMRAKLDMLRNMIFAAWHFDDFIGQTAQKAKLCEDRIQQIHNKSSERSGFITDLLLLIIGVVSIFGLALDFAHSAREFSTDATVGLRDEGAINILSYFSGRMDSVLGWAFVVVLVIVASYGVARWRKLL